MPIVPPASLAGHVPSRTYRPLSETEPHAWVASGVYNLQPCAHCLRGACSHQHPCQCNSMKTQEYLGPHLPVTFSYSSRGAGLSPQPESRMPNTHRPTFKLGEVRKQISAFCNPGKQTKGLPNRPFCSVCLCAAPEGIEGRHLNPQTSQAPGTWPNTSRGDPVLMLYPQQEGRNGWPLGAFPIELCLPRAPALANRTQANRSQN